MKIRRVNHTGISVADMERSLGFYRDLLERVEPLPGV